VTSSSRSTRVGLGIALPTLVLALAGRGWAQTPGGSTGGTDPTRLELPLTATVRVPLWSGSPVTIRVFGEVPSSELKRAALLRVERAATTERSVRARIKSSRIGVVPIASKPPLRRARSG
jgi:hypothetical protein